ncbi:MAG TPA: GatB/YqeY domain-containing protein, partial [Alphaproteobacteria bacterium]|nr:GatB/YqeY domain-containing protein [Alphaproteobacteria bacterium]
TRFQEQLKQSLHAKDEIAVSTLRLIIAAMKDRDIAARGKGNWEGITEDEILAMLQSMIKQRHESIKMYQQGKRDDLAAREASEIRVIETFLPAQLSEDEVKVAIDTAIEAVGAAGIKDMGKVIADMKSKYTGQVDFSKVSALVKERLTPKA